MDYCSSCRRHLNGALVCPGCGAYAPDIAPVTDHGRGFEPFAAKRPPRPEPHPYEPFEETSAAEAALPAGEGRAARRRQRARWKKNQRKAVLATTVALVGGGLTLATMNQGSDHRAEAATAPDLTSTGAQELPAQQYAEPTVAPPGTGKHRKPEATHHAAPAAGTPRSTSTATPDAPHTTSERTRPYTAPHTAPASPPQTASHPASGTASGTSGGSGSTTPTQSPSATPSGSTSSSGSSGSSSSGSSGSSSSGTSGTSGSNSSQPGTAPAATSPSQVCVLGLLCLS